MRTNRYRVVVVTFAISIHVRVHVRRVTLSRLGLQYVVVVAVAVVELHFTINQPDRRHFV